MAATRSTCRCPSVTFPNGGEMITGRSITIALHKPVPTSTDGVPVWHEVFFTDDYEADKQISWKQIAFIPASATSFVWSIPFGVRSPKCRLASRCRDARGAAGEMQLNGDNFEITSQRLSAPGVVTPTTGSTHRLSVEIVLDHSGLEGTYSQRSYYQIYYSSLALGVDWTPVSENFPVGSNSLTWDVRDLDPSSDYRLKVSTVNEDGLSSDPVFVDDITISPLNYAILDSTPPQGRIVIQGNTGFANQRDVVLGLDAFDETTEVKSVGIRQIAVSDPYGLKIGEVEEEGEQSFTDVISWHLSGEDGTKLVEAKFKDAAGNVLTGSNGQKFFRLYLKNSNDEVTALTLQDDTVWTAFFNGQAPLYKDRAIEVLMPNPATALEVFDDIVHVAGRNVSNERGLLQKYDATTNAVVTIHAFTTLDSVITSMAVFQNELYMAMENGDLYKYNKTTITLVSSFSTQIRGMFANPLALYLFFENTKDIQLFDGMSFVTVDFLNGSQ